MLQSQFGRLPAQRGMPVQVYEAERQATVWEQGLLVVWFFALYVPLPEFAMIRYVCILSIVGLFAWHHSETVPLLLRSWPLLLVPIMSALSIFWTPYPAEAIAPAILLLLTPIILVTIAARLRAAEFVRVLMIAGALAALYCVPFFSTLKEGGPYAQKNILAFQMMLVTVVSLAAALNANEKLILRLLGFATVPLAFTLQLIADSATALVLALAGAALLIGVKLFWTAASRVAHARSLVLASTVMLGLIATLLLLSLPQNSVLDDFLGLVGKDSTLTGRTGIWDGAARASEEYPWFGIGIEGFWQYNTGLAQTLSESVHKDPGDNISFHSSFWEVRVHLGLVGLGLFCFAIAWAGLRTIRLWLHEGSVVNSVLLFFFLSIGASSLTESYTEGPSSTIVSLFYFGGLAAFRIGERKLVGTARLIERSV